MPIFYEKEGKDKGRRGWMEKKESRLAARFGEEFVNRGEGGRERKETIGRPGAQLRCSVWKKKKKRGVNSKRKEKRNEKRRGRCKRIRFATLKNH